MGLKWTVIVFVATLLSCGGFLNWQGAGNMTQDNLTTIRNKINGLNFNVDPSTYAALATTLSNELNALWAPAWNVVFVLYADGKNFDSLLYGYGFNGHWFWFNGY
jgi:hypothetical protein